MPRMALKPMDEHDAIPVNCTLRLMSSISAHSAIISFGSPGSHNTVKPALFTRASLGSTICETWVNVQYHSEEAVTIAANNRPTMFDYLQCQNLGRYKQNAQNLYETTNQEESYKIRRKTIKRRHHYSVPLAVRKEIVPSLCICVTINNRPIKILCNHIICLYALIGDNIDQAWTWRTSKVFSLTVFQHGIEHDDLTIV